MVTKHLGYTIDICCGGIDNLYRHHDYNIAVIEAASGKEFARYWVHGEHLLVNGKKMSKSLGNIIYPDDLMNDGHTGQHVRFYLLYGHHRKRINFTPASFQKTTKKLDQLKEMVQAILSGTVDPPFPAMLNMVTERLIAALPRVFEDRMGDDLDVGGALHRDLRGVVQPPVRKGDVTTMISITKGELNRKCGGLTLFLQVIVPL